MMKWLLLGNKIIKPVKKAMKKRDRNMNENKLKKMNFMEWGKKKVIGNRVKYVNRCYKQN